MEQTETNFLKKRMQTLIAGRLRDETKIREAIKMQDRLSEKSGSWSGEEEIKKWREEH